MHGFHESYIFICGSCLQMIQNLIHRKKLTMPKKELRCDADAWSISRAEYDQNFTSMGWTNADVLIPADADAL